MTTCAIMCSCFARESNAVVTSIPTYVSSRFIKFPLLSLFVQKLNWNKSKYNHDRIYTFPLSDLYVSLYCNQFRCHSNFETIDQSANFLQQ